VKYLLKGYDLSQKSLGRIPLRVVALLASTAATSLPLCHSQLSISLPPDSLFGVSCCWN